MKAARTVIVVSTLCVSLLLVPKAEAQLTPQEKVRKAFSLVGQWVITKMEVSKHGFASSNPSAAGAALASVSIDIGSSLGEGLFEVHPDGTITGNGSALYHYRVSGGTTPGVGSGGFTGLGYSIPVGASAMLDVAADDGKRAFSISGQADIAQRTISLKAFQPTGGPLKVIIEPTSTPITAALWPPMTNVDPTNVVVQGASLLLRAAGVVGGMQVSIEAVKYVDLAGLFESILASCGCSNAQGGTSSIQILASGEPLFATVSVIEENTAARNSRTNASPASGVKTPICAAQ